MTAVASFQKCPRRGAVLEETVCCSYFQINADSCVLQTLSTAGLHNLLHQHLSCLSIPVWSRWGLSQRFLPAQCFICSRLHRWSFDRSSFPIPAVDILKPNFSLNFLPALQMHSSWPICYLLPLSCSAKPLTSKSRRLLRAAPGSA